MSEKKTERTWSRGWWGWSTCCSPFGGISLLTKEEKKEMLSDYKKTLEEELKRTEKLLAEIA
jgi:hypothetical protein